MDIASLSGPARAKLYRDYAEAARKQAEDADSGSRDYFLGVAQSWEQLARSIERVQISEKFRSDTTGDANPR